MPSRANQEWGDENGQENLEEVEEDRSDQALDGCDAHQPEALILVFRFAKQPSTLAAATVGSTL